MIMTGLVVFAQFSPAVIDDAAPAASCSFRKYPKGVAAVHGVVQNLFRLGRHLLRAVHHRWLRTRAFIEGQVEMCAR